MTKRYKKVSYCAAFCAETGKSAPIESGCTICLLCLLIYFRKFSLLFRWLFFWPLPLPFSHDRIKRNTVFGCYQMRDKNKRIRTKRTTKQISKWKIFTPNRLARVGAFFSSGVYKWNSGYMEFEYGTCRLKIIFTNAHTHTKKRDARTWSALSALKQKIFSKNERSCNIHCERNYAKKKIYQGN